MGCPISTPEIKSKESTFTSVDKLFKKDNVEAAGIMKGFLDIMYKQKGTEAEAIQNMGELPADLYGYVQKYAPAIAGSVTKDSKVDDVMMLLVKHPESLGRMVWAAEKELNILAGFNFNPKQLTDDIRNNNNFYNFYSNIYSLYKNNDLIGMTLIAGRENPHYIDKFGDKSVFFKQHAVANDLETKLEIINNRTRDYFSDADKAHQKILKHYADKSDGNLSIDDLQKYVKFAANKDVTLDKKLTDDFNSDTAKIDIVKRSIVEYYQELQKMNYGMADTEFKKIVESDPNIPKENTDNLKYYRDRSAVLYENKELGLKLQSYLSFVALTGKDMVSLIKTGRENEVNKLGGWQSVFNAKDDAQALKVLHPGERYILSKFDPTVSNELFSPKTLGYVPAVANDPLLALVQDNSTFKNVFTEVATLAKSDGRDKIDDTPFIESWRKNAKQFHHLITRVSEYSTKASELIALKSGDEEFKQLNPKAYTLIKKDADVIMEDFNELFHGQRNKHSPIFYAFKRLSIATLGAVATSILARSGIMNIAAGSLGVSTRFGTKNAIDLISNYLASKSSTGLDGVVARAVQDHMKWEAPVSTKGEELHLKSSQMVDDSSLLTKTLDTISRGLGKYSEFSSNGGMLSLIPIFKKQIEKLSFNDTENRLASFNGVLLNDKVNSHMQEYSAANPNVKIGSDEFNKVMHNTIRQYEGLAITQTKEAIGNFSRYAKPMYSWKKLRDADTLPQVMIGMLYSSAYMFKQVVALNAGLLARIGTTLGLSASKNAIDFKRLMSNVTSKHTQSSLSVGLGVLALGLYNALTEDEDDMPQISLLKQIDVTDVPVKVFKAAMGFGLKAWNNEPVTEKEMNRGIDLLKFIAGVGISNSLRLENVTNDKELMEGLDFASIGDSFDDLITNTGNVFGTFTEGPDKMRDFKKAVYGIMDSDLKHIPFFGPLVSKSNDNFKSIANLLITAKTAVDIAVSDTKDEEYKAGNQFSNNFYKQALGLAGLTVWFNKDHWKNRYKKSYTAYDDSYLLYKAASTKRYSNRYSYNQRTIADGILRNITKGYGVNGQSIWRITANQLNYEAQKRREANDGQ